jgi:putative sigma-54 modulation protein
MGHNSSLNDEQYTRTFRIYFTHRSIYLDHVIIQLRSQKMQLDIRASGFELTAGLREHAERRLHLTLDWARHDFNKVILRFTDINGPRGGNDKRCLLRIPMAHMREVVIEDTAADLYIAIDCAIDRAGRTLERRLARQREFGPLLRHPQKDYQEKSAG